MPGFDLGHSKRKSKRTLPINSEKLEIDWPDRPRRLLRI